MSKKRDPAKLVCKPRSGNGYWIDHAEIVEHDLEWLCDAERLTLWNVVVPQGFLKRLEKLWWLDVRGGTAVDLRVAAGAEKLRYLAVNQVRGLQDLSVVAEIPSLQLIDFYGLPKVTHIPSLAHHTKLIRANIGQMSGLLNLQGLLAAPHLRELQLARAVAVSSDDVDRIVDHPAIKCFEWIAEDVPHKTWGPIVERIRLPKTQCLHPEEWFSALDATLQI